jgi:hypothetical protein
MSTTKSKKKQHICLVKWRKRIDNAEKRYVKNHNFYRVGFTRYECNLASSWKVCAVGEAHQLLPNLVQYKFNPYFGQAAPTDEILKKLGLKFVNMVNANNFKGARKTLNTIEERLNQLYVLV